MLHHAIPGDTEKICADRTSRNIVFLRLAHQRHEHVLYYLLGSPGIAGHAQRKAIQRCLMPAIEQGERLLVTLSGAPQQNVVPVLLRNTHLSWYGVHRRQTVY